MTAKKASGDGVVAPFDPHVQAGPSGFKADIDAAFRLKEFGYKGDGQAVTDWNEIRDLLYEDGRDLK